MKSPAHRRETEKHLMRLHGGRVHVESELGSGSRFFLVFPPDPFRDDSL
jgi:signal transduction histidine kinase